jgi:hypothetical protein
MPGQEPTLEELRAKLKEMGLPTDGWGKTKAGTMNSPILEHQKQAMLKIKGVLEEQVKSDRDLLSELHEKRNRLEHGGGV